MERREAIQRAVYAALGHVRPDYRSPKALDEAAFVIADFVDHELRQEADSQVDAAIAAERERCAKVVENIAGKAGTFLAANIRGIGERSVGDRIAGGEPLSQLPHTREVAAK